MYNPVTPRAISSSHDSPLSNEWFTLGLQIAYYFKLQYHRNDLQTDLDFGNTPPVACTVATSRERASRSEYEDHQVHMPCLQIQLVHFRLVNLML